MRGKLSEQERTNYALNDGLEARQRRRVESMLGLCEEGREDVCRQMELAEMLAEGFEQAAEEENGPALTAAQRQQLLSPRGRSGPGGLGRPLAGVLAMAAAAAVALVCTFTGVWSKPPAGSAGMAGVSNGVKRMVTEAMTPADSEDDYVAWVIPPTVSDEDAAAFVQTTGESMPVLQAEESDREWATEEGAFAP